VDGILTEDELKQVQLTIVNTPAGDIAPLISGPDDLKKKVGVCT